MKAHGLIFEKTVTHASHGRAFLHGRDSPECGRCVTGLCDVHWRACAHRALHPLSRRAGRGGQLCPLSALGSEGTPGGHEVRMLSSAIGPPSTSKHPPSAFSGAGISSGKLSVWGLRRGTQGPSRVTLCQPADAVNASWLDPLAPPSCFCRAAPDQGRPLPSIF